MEVSDRIILGKFEGVGMMSDCLRDGGLLLGRKLSPEGTRGSWLGLSRDLSSSIYGQ